MNESFSDLDHIQFDLPKHQSNVIKVIGVGGGGSNAINHMFEAGIKGVDFVVCNTDAQALENSAVPNKIQLGISLTEGLGAGANPEVGEKAAQESVEDIRAMLDTQTKMVFITAGMGGGTGTGAAPVIARAAKEMDILTVGIVTTPFLFEGKMRNDQAQAGIAKLRQSVDSLIIINNNKLREVYGNLGFKAGFSKADEVLATAAKGIAEVITHHYTQNIDLRDAKTVLANSGSAIMGSARATGKGRALEAISSALDSPLLNDNKITGAKNVLLLIVSGTSEITIDEIGEINDYIQAEAGQCANIIMGVGEDINLGESIAVTVIATGFNPEQQNEIVNTEAKKIIHTLEDEQRVNLNLMGQATTVEPPIYFDLECEAEFVVPQAADEQPEPLVAHIQDEVVEEELVEEPTASLFDTPLSEVTPEEPVITHVLDWSDEAAAFGFDLSDEQLESDQEMASEDVLIPTTEALRLLEVYDVQVVTPEVPSAPVDEVDQEAFEQEMEFQIIEKSSASAPSLVEEEPVFEEQTSLFFDLTIEEVQAPKISVPEELTSAQIWNLEVIDAEIVAPKVQRQEPAPSAFISEEAPAKRYSLEDYMELEQKLTQAQPEPKEAEVAELPEFQFEHKVIETPLAQESSVEIDPMESPIADLLKARTEERKRQFKEFNYHFNNSLQRIDEIEKEPAYKRQGISLDQNPVEAKLSRTTLSADPNEEDRLRTNNSFLHDNVD